MFAMNSCFIFAAFLQLVISSPSYDVHDSFYLIPVISPDGKSSIIQKCIGERITPNHIIAPASCLHFDNVLPDSYYLATGVFIDYREEKKYSADPSVLPLSNLAFTNNITVHPDFKRGQAENDVAIITLPIPFSNYNSLMIKTNKIGKVSETDEPFISYYEYDNKDGIMKVDYFPKNMFENKMLPGIVRKSNYISGFMVGANAEVTLKEKCAWILEVTGGGDYCS